jgi:hypothetical protein
LKDLRRSFDTAVIPGAEAIFREERLPLDSLIEAQRTRVRSEETRIEELQSSEGRSITTEEISHIKRLYSELENYKSRLRSFEIGYGLFVVSASNSIQGGWSPWGRLGSPWDI